MTWLYKFLISERFMTFKLYNPLPNGQKKGGQLDLSWTDVGCRRVSGT